MLSLAACAHVDPREAPGYTTSRHGGAHDFDWVDGAWTTRQRRLTARGVGSTNWEEFPATLCATLHLDGLVTTAEIAMPTKGRKGFTLRTFDVERRQWSSYWVNSQTGRLETPVRGGFEGNRGELYGEDTDAGRRVAVRYVWTLIDADHARWEQAFSYDGRSWETNWTADFTRADPAIECVSGRPKG
jgi:hypothetical protein